VSDQDRSYEGLASLLAGIGVGAVIGAVTALLLAPHSGAETRSHIGDTTHDLLGKMRDTMDEVRTKLDQVVQQTRQALGRMEGAPGAAELAPDGDASERSAATS
jgi:gas vesicle protein